MSISPQNIFIDLNQAPQDILSPNEEYLPLLPPLIDLNQYPEDIYPLTSSNVNIPPPENISNPSKKKNLNVDQKRAIADILFQQTDHGILPRGAIYKVADYSNRLIMVKRVGRKKVEIELGAMKSVPFHRRTNIRSLANALGLGKSTVHRRIKEKSIRPHSNPVKPYLSNDNKKSRLEFCLSMIEEGTLETQSSFIAMYDQIHIDEKWFYISKTSQKYYLYPDEMEPYRTCKSKRFFAKIMFLAAVARPRFDSTTSGGFDGKVGIWSFVCKEPAKRSSKNRRAGTLETKPISSITKDIICSCLIEKLLPSIKEKWLAGSFSIIFIQQDNARPHIDANDVKFLEGAERYGAFDSLQHQEAPSTIDEFVSAVEKAFHMFPKEDLNNVFLTRQSCMVEILRNFGGNNYKIPHMNKQKLARSGELPICIQCDSQVLNEAKEARAAEI